jgi:hypothetical protein
MTFYLENPAKDGMSYDLPSSKIYDKDTFEDGIKFTGICLMDGSIVLVILTDINIFTHITRQIRGKTKPVGTISRPGRAALLRVTLFCKL